MSKPILLDIMRGDAFVCQLKYSNPCRLDIIDGEIQEVHDIDVIKEWVFEQRPSLRDTRGIRIAFSNQKI